MTDWKTLIQIKRIAVVNKVTIYYVHRKGTRSKKTKEILNLQKNKNERN